MRALALAAPNVLFVATNHGVLHRATIRRDSDGGWTWREAWRASSGTETGTPIMSVALLDPAKDGSARVALGDGAGRVSIVAVTPGDRLETRTESSWSAAAPRRLLDVFRCADGACSRPRSGGVVRRWRAPETEDGEWKLSGTARACRSGGACSRRRITRGRVSPSSAIKTETSPRSRILTETKTETEDARSELALLAAARSAHGQQAVSLVEIRGDAVGRSDDWESLEIVTGGRDGRLCTFALRGAATTSAAEAERLRARLENETRAAAAAEVAAEAAANGDGSNHAAAKRAGESRRRRRRASRWPRARWRRRRRLDDSRASPSNSSRPYPRRRRCVGTTRGAGRGDGDPRPRRGVQGDVLRRVRLGESVRAPPRAVRRVAQTANASARPERRRSVRVRVLPGG